MFPLEHERESDINKQLSTRNTEKLKALTCEQYYFRYVSLGGGVKSGRARAKNQSAKAPRPLFPLGHLKSRLTQKAQKAVLELLNDGNLPCLNNKPANGAREFRPQPAPQSQSESVLPVVPRLGRFEWFEYCACNHGNLLYGFVILFNRWPFTTTLPHNLAVSFTNRGHLTTLRLSPRQFV